MENQFDFLAIEAAYEASIVKEEGKPDYSTLTAEAIESITWPLAVNEELKATDEQGDLCTIVNTGSEIHYIHRSNREEWQAGVIEFKVPLVANNEDATQTEPSQETQPEAETAVN